MPRQTGEYVYVSNPPSHQVWEARVIADGPRETCVVYYGGNPHDSDSDGNQPRFVEHEYIFDTRVEADAAYKTKSDEHYQRMLERMGRA